MLTQVHNDVSCDSTLLQNRGKKGQKNEIKFHIMFITSYFLSHSSKNCNLQVSIFIPFEVILWLLHLTLSE